jgi:curved DNA-binding protein CbpA
MTDYFALLNEPRRAWIDPDSLKEKFLQLSASVHPDRVHNLGDSERAAAREHYVKLNAAFNCLQQPKLRLAHLIELESGAKPNDIQSIPSELLNWFGEVGDACRGADRLLSEKGKISSPLLQVQWFQKSQEQIAILQELQQRLNIRRQALIDSLKQLDAVWIAASASERTKLLTQLEELHRMFAYFDRWLAQVQEKSATLSF